LRRRLIIGLVVLGLCMLTWTLVFRRSGDGPLYQGKTIHGWAAQLLAPGPEVRERAAVVLRGLGTNAVPGLIRLLEARDPLWRTQLWRWGPRLPVRLRRRLLLHSRLPQEALNRQEACMALAIIGPDAKAAVPALGCLLLSKEPETMWYLGDALGAIGKDSLPVLTNALGHSDARVRTTAIFALKKLGPAAEPAVLPLLQRVADSNADVRVRAVDALVEMGPPAVPALVQAVEREKGQVRRGAARALMHPGVSRRLAEPALLGMLHDDDPASRQQAIATLAAVRVREEPAILAIAAALKDPIPAVRLAAANGLGEVSGKAQPAVPALIETLRDGSAEVRSSAARTLGLIGPPANTAQPALTRLAEDADASVRAAANEALVRIQAKQGGQLSQ
jgi:HEAT repeat protein